MKVTNYIYMLAVFAVVSALLGEFVGEREFFKWMSLVFVVAHFAILIFDGYRHCINHENEQKEYEQTRPLRRLELGK